MVIEDSHGMIVAEKLVSSVRCSENYHCSTSISIGHLNTHTYRVNVNAVYGTNNGDRRSSPVTSTDHLSKY